MAVIQASSLVPLSAEVDEAVLGGQGHSEFFPSLMSALRTEELFQHSPRGKAAEEVLQFTLKHSGGDSVARIAIRRSTAAFVWERNTNCHLQYKRDYHYFLTVTLQICYTTAI